MNITKELSREHRMKLLNILSVPHSHSDMTLWAKCGTCQDKFLEYKKAKAKLPELEKVRLEREVTKKAADIFNKMQARGLIPAT